jgi:hypothetical protein
MITDINLLLSSSESNRLIEFNGGTSSFSVAVEGGGLDWPSGIACISEIMCLFANRDSNNVVAVNLRGHIMGVFAQVATPHGLLHIEHLNLLAVASRVGNGFIFIFDLADLDLDQPLQVSAQPPSHFHSLY